VTFFLRLSGVLKKNGTQDAPRTNGPTATTCNHHERTKPNEQTGLLGISKTHAAQPEAPPRCRASNAFQAAALQNGTVDTRLAYLF
jgi:hypothetical protein